MKEYFIPADVAPLQDATLPTERALMGQEPIRETLAFLGFGKPKIVRREVTGSSDHVNYGLPKVEYGYEVKGKIRFGEVDGGWKNDGNEASQGNPNPDNRATKLGFYREKTFVPFNKK